MGAEAGFSSARDPQADKGVPVEEFQRRRTERLRESQRRAPGHPATGTVHSGDTAAPDVDDFDSFDPASLRSDR